MSEARRITQQMLDAVKISESRLDRILIPLLVLAGIAFAVLQIFQQDWLELVVFGVGLVILLALLVVRPLQMRLLGQRFNRRHATYVALYWVYAILWLRSLRLLEATPSSGKESEQFYVYFILLLALTVMMIRALLMLTPFGYRTFIARIPIWEQFLVALNELIAAGLLAYVGGYLLIRLLQPAVFTTRFDPIYSLALLATVLVYYVGIQLMWLQRGNDWFSTNHVWVALTRLFAPFVLLVASLVLVNRLAQRADPRTANLLGNTDYDLAILALGPVIWVVILVVMFLVYTSSRGLRQRFLPNLLLDRLPPRLARYLASISDMDMLLVIGVLSLTVPTYLFLFGDRSDLIRILREQIFRRGGPLLETSEQALALLLTIPFYVLIVAMLAVYAYAISRASLPAHDRDELMNQLPVGFLIVLIITLYLFAVPFSQVLTEGRLPQLPQDLGRILAFDVLIPLVLLYTHYFLLIRWPYGRGQSRWREQEQRKLFTQLQDIDRRIDNLNHELEQLDRGWRDPRATEQGLRFEALYRYVQINGMRDNLNMQRLQIVSARQQLAELSETPVSVAVARLPTRVLSLAIPLLLLVQLYQWAILNEGLRQVANNPNLTVLDFVQILLQNIQF